MSFKDFVQLSGTVLAILERVLRGTFMRNYFEFGPEVQRRVQQKERLRALVLVPIFIRNL